MNTDCNCEMEGYEMSSEFEGEEELNRFRRSFSPRVNTPRINMPRGNAPRVNVPRGNAPRGNAPRPNLQRPRPRPVPPRKRKYLPPRGARRMYLYAPESPLGSEYVRWVQTILNQVLDLQLPADGVMSVETRSAIRSFQEKNGLAVTGIVGPDTERALIASSGGQSSLAGASQSADSAAAGFEPGGTASAQPTISTEPPSTTELELSETGWTNEINRGSSDYIKWVQQSLNQIMGLRLAVDGIVGTYTRSAIRSFQQQKGLLVDGIVGPQTEGALIAAGAGAPPAAGTIPTPTTGTNPKINALLPASGPGFYSKYTDPNDVSGRGHQYGLPETIRAIQAIGAAWQRRYPQGPRIGVTHISLKGGGDTPYHVGHENGLEVDVRPVRNDGREDGVKITDPAYSRALTQVLVNTIRANSVLKVDRILFADRGITPVSYASDHDDHLHIYFLPPVVSSPVAQPATGLLAWGARVSPAFRTRVRQIGGELGINPNFLMAVMAFETGETFNPAIRNPSSGATGLIQFTKTTAGKLGTSTDSLARMTAEQQLDYVALYFRPYKGQLKTIEDVYMAVLYGPGAVGKPNATVLFSTPSIEYQWNKGLDSNGDGRITKAEAAAPVIARLNKGMQAGLAG